MILQSLCRYYDILAENGDCKIPREGESNANISFGLELSQDGQIKRILDLREDSGVNGKTKLVPRSMLVPMQKARVTNNDPYFLCDKSDYVLGIKNKEVTADQFQFFKEMHLKFLQNLDDDDAIALVHFLNNWQPETAHECLKQISGYTDDVVNSIAPSFVFRSNRWEYMHQNPKLINIKIYEDSEHQGLCLVSGQKSGIARIHDIKIKGVTGAQAAGATIVSCKEPAYESYGKTQSFNGPVAEEMVFKYANALNWLLMKQKTIIGDSTVVFWAESARPNYANLVQQLTNPEIKAEKNLDEADRARNLQLEKDVRAVLNAYREGRKINDPRGEIDPNTNFYILALAPNNARISVRYFLRDTFGALINKINRHYEDLKLNGSRWEYPPLWLLLSETIPKNARDKKAPAPLAAALAQAVFTGGRYPYALISGIIQRVRADHEINDIRASIIKAYLKRAARIKKDNKLEEILSMSLNSQTTDQAYLQGRLFAVLERIQENAQGDINKTIKDSYFSTASASPRTVFPQLIRLAQYHLSKLGEKGLWLEIIMGGILNNIEEFPAYFNLEGQGRFILGYYQQRQDFFTKKSDRNKSETVTEVA